MKIVGIDKDSLLYGKVPSGAELARINGHKITDEIDLQVYGTEDVLRMEFVYKRKRISLTLRNISYNDLGMQFETPKIRVCDNKCIFCFVHQQPREMRHSLYVKDDDYRQSFIHGNYISLSNLTESDYERIIRQRLSPLYVSVHTTDDKLRRFIFHNRRLKPILPALRRLTSHGISIHAQAVICPGINDGSHLDRTITELASLAPGISSLAIVPVGLTRYREKLPCLRSFNQQEALNVIRRVEEHQERCLKHLNSRFVYPADEFFLLAKRPIPPLNYYEDMPQFENGVGMVRQFIVDFNRRRRYLPQRVKRPMRLGLVTGHSAERFVRETVLPCLKSIGRLTTELIPVDNRFWGKTVTVTGLLTGKDIQTALRKSRADVIILPPNCLNVDGVFLDDVSLAQFCAWAKRPVLIGKYQIASSIGEAIRYWEN